MRRLPRILLNAVTAASLVLCAATITLWAWTSASRAYVLLSYTWPLRATFVVVAGGEFRLEYTRVVNPMLPNPRTSFDHEFDIPSWSGGGVFPDRIPGRWVHFRRGAFALVTGERWNDYHYALFLPGWCVLLSTALVPVARFTTPLLTRSAKSPGLCPSCGYDLRATPARCHECGTTPAR